MTWVETTMQQDSPSMRADVSFPALQTRGATVGYTGAHMQRAVFLYRGAGLTLERYRAPVPAIEDVGIFGMRQPAGGGYFGSIWVIDTSHLSHRYNLSPEQISELKRHVKDALLSHPTWPPDFRPQDGPAVAVEFTTPD
jgi:hypothetical protein